MDDYVAAVAAAMAAYRRRKQRIKNIDLLALVMGLFDDKDAIMSQNDTITYLDVALAYSCVLGTNYMLLEAACTALFAWHVATCQLHSCDCAIKSYININSPTRSKTTCCAMPRLQVLIGAQVN